MSDKDKNKNLIICGGWNSKMGPADLYGILEKLPQKKDENLLVG